VGCLNDTIRKVLTHGLVTQFCALPRVTKKFLSEDVEQWGKLHHLEGEDIMHMNDIVAKCMDG